MMVYAKRNDNTDIYTFSIVLQFILGIVLEVYSGILPENIDRIYTVLFESYALYLQRQDNVGRFHTISVFSFLHYICHLA